MNISYPSRAKSASFVTSTLRVSLLLASFWYDASLAALTIEKQNGRFQILANPNIVFFSFSNPWILLDGYCQKKLLKWLHLFNYVFDLKLIIDLLIIKKNKKKVITFIITYHWLDIINLTTIINRNITEFATIINITFVIIFYHLHSRNHKYRHK